MEQRAAVLNISPRDDVSMVSSSSDREAPFRRSPHHLLQVEQQEELLRKWQKQKQYQSQLKEQMSERMIRTHVDTQERWTGGECCGAEREHIKHRHIHCPAARSTNTARDACAQSSCLHHGRAEPVVVATGKASDSEPDSERGRPPDEPFCSCTSCG